jgi:hypothetical protein
MGKVSRNKAIRSAPLEGYLPDEHVSFNIRRSSIPSNPSLRTITLFPGQARPLVVPGLDPGKESDLLAELKRVQNWKQVETNGYRVPPLLFSFLWRFHGGAGGPPLGFQSLAPFPPKIAKMIESAYKQYRNRLAINLAPGQIFLIPDAEVSFGHRSRQVKPYARRVLIAKVQAEQAIIVPFSTRTDWINRSSDILFDPKTKGELSFDARPAVENFPSLLFSRPSLLKISCAQPIGSDEFLSYALICIGAIRREVMNLVIERLKKG